MNELNQPSCSLCSGQGCLTRLSGMQPVQGRNLPGRIMIVIYGFPLACLLLGSLLGALQGEVESIFGAALGLIFSFFALRSCQRFLNRLS